MNELNDIEMSFSEVNLNNWRSPRSQLFRHGGSRIENKFEFLVTLSLIQASVHSLICDFGSQISC
jgi:hypothetical protein